MSTQADIDRGLAIKEQIAALTEELKGIQTRVDAAALRGPQIPLEDAERDGTQYLARGSEKVVPVIITADFLAASFTKDSPKHQAVLDALLEPALLESFYGREVSFKRKIEDGKAFRKAARELIGGAPAEEFIAACVARDKHGIAKSAIKIAWDRARPIEGKVVAHA